jgi:peptidoglycan/LPS O-acetylase OafA/YrhL
MLRPPAFLCNAPSQRDLPVATAAHSSERAALRIAARRFQAWPVLRFLNFRWVAFIGTLSYSLYLVHEVLLRAVTRLWPRWHGSLLVMTALAASVIAASAIYVLIERPCAVLRKRLTQ